MPIRLEPLINNRIYHVFNKTIDDRKIFESDSNCNKFLETIRYYRSSKAKISLSKLKILDPTTKKEIINLVSMAKYFRVELLAYNLMPNHFHLLIEQKKDNGIQRFVADTINSFTRHINISTERKGPLFLSRFKAVMIKTDDQLKHVSRYIHLQHYSGGLMDDIHNLAELTWSSYPAYLGTADNLVNTKDIMALFDFNQRRYRQFVESNADHQRTLEIVKHALKW